MNRTISIIITTVLIIGIGIVFFRQSKEYPDSVGTQPIENVEIKEQSKKYFDSTDVQLTQNIEIRDGIQYITINARGGYSPKISTAQANIPTKLVIKTKDTYDCSSALVIKSIGYQKILPQTGEEIIDLNAPQVGTIQGICSMGMYSFIVNFK